MPVLSEQFCCFLPLKKSTGGPSAEEQKCRYLALNANAKRSTDPQTSSGGKLPAVTPCAPIGAGRSASIPVEIDGLAEALL
jgi:hypothetical protein